jgi:uncharacterized protein with HEPN domain
MSKRDNNLLLQDIFESSSKILRFTEKFSFEDFINDERTVDAVIRNFEIIGEASRNLSEEFTSRHLQISWRELISYRNLLIHEYFGVSLKIVWDIIQTDLPKLMHIIEPLLNKK